MNDLKPQGVAEESMAIVPHDYMTPADVSARLRIAKSALYERLSRGEIPHVRFGRAIRIREAELARYLARSSREREPEPYDSRQTR